MWMDYISAVFAEIAVASPPALPFPSQMIMAKWGHALPAGTLREWLLPARLSLYRSLPIVITPRVWSPCLARFNYLERTVQWSMGVIPLYGSIPSHPKKFTGGGISLSCNTKIFYCDACITAKGH